jgi:multiple antibiotic resistance protein
MDGIVGELAASTFLVVGTLFPVVNPLGNTPIFLTLTYGLTDEARTRLARSIAINGLILMIGSILIGTHILGFFGISLPVVEVGGGLVVVSTGWSLLRSPDEDDSGTEEKRPCNQSNYMRRAFYPLTLPLTVGPGTIALAITVGANRAEGTQWQWHMIGLLIGVCGIAFSIYVCYRYAEKVADALGETAMNVVIRLSSFILICIGVQIIWNGVSALLKSVVER